jgi:hypothetical protein
MATPEERELQEVVRGVFDCSNRNGLFLRALEDLSGHLGVALKSFQDGSATSETISTLKACVAKLSQLTNLIHTNGLRQLDTAVKDYERQTAA